MRWVCPEEAIAPEKNLVLKALNLFREKTGFNSSLKIDLIKHIPSGAGLGGGSSDAASTLIALNKLSKKALSPDQLREMALQLGSDVPFFLTGGAAFVSGRGELVTKISPPEGLFVVLVKPPFSSNTKTAFKLLDLAREEQKLKNPPENVSKKTVSELILALKSPPQTWPFFNDFSALFIDMCNTLCPDNSENADTYRLILETLRKKGASFAGLSGSGSCCFGVFEEEKTAKEAEKTLSKHGNYARSTIFLAQNANSVLE